MISPSQLTPKLSEKEHMTGSNSHQILAFLFFGNKKADVSLSRTEQSIEFRLVKAK